VGEHSACRRGLGAPAVPDGEAIRRLEKQPRLSCDEHEAPGRQWKAAVQPAHCVLPAQAWPPEGSAHALSRPPQRAMHAEAPERCP
jgi:hypothetical protein